MSDRGASRTRSAVGICLSGGGLRAASFGLGALQALDDRLGLVTGEDHADYLSAVSGGSYVAGAYALAAKDRYPGEPDAEVGPPPGAPPLFGRGSPEELWLRRHCRYLLDVPGGALSTLWLVLVRLANVLLFVFLVLFVVGRPLGWVYGSRYPEFARNLGCRRTPACERVDLKVSGIVPTVVFAVIGLGVVLALLAPVRRWGLRPRTILEKGSSRVLAAGLAGLALLVALPAVLAVMENTRRGTAGGTWLTDLVATDARSAGTAAVGLAVSLAVAATGLRAARVPDAGMRRLRRLAVKVWPTVAGVLASLAGPVLGLALFLRIVLGGAVKHVDGRTQHAWDLVWWLATVVLVALALWQADIVAWSLHSTYKRRLFACFGLRRTTSHGLPAVTNRRYSYPFPMSETYPYRRAEPGAVPGAERVPGARFPSLVICAALNVSDRGQTPAGSKVLPWIFSAERIGVPQEPADEWSFDTRALEDSFGPLEWYASGPPRSGSWLHRHYLALRGRPFLSLDNRKRVSLPAAMAIAGAAVSPSMGRMTKAPVRFLLALFNLRLGVWLPNPHHPWVRSRVEGEGRELRMWSRPWYLFFEMFGRNRLDKRFVYVSDGGHYENLGLVELLRRRCTTIWCVDASGDEPGTASTLAQAMALARAELNVEVRVDLDRFASTDGSTPAARRQVATHVVGSVHYAATATAPAAEGTIVVVKLGLTGAEPADLLDYQRRAPTFPYEATSNQLYNAERFDAYRALGFVTTATAADDVGRA